MSDQVIEEDWHIINETIITESAVVSKNGKRLRQRATIQLRSTAFNITANW
jgi:hypothetical protein